MITTGVLAPTLAASMPSVAVKAYAGATEEIPSMVPPNRPTTLLFKPLSAISTTLLEAVRSNDEGLALESVVLHDVLDAGVVLEPVHRQILAVTGVLVAPMRHLRLQRNMAVVPDTTEVQPSRHPHRSA